ncbi:hypothetical protein BV25DRAFT_1916139 [Artomyces pyxidatus]|uniref:Uncharacterized protein n=1 Tax=Artomyces pyxidatus TaxID=48021 RepID=A0ACB8T274_9AGAM|nr:hypothetical protein BV25DRAFT_1916139 [Artomyces pyxidatus]
MGASQSIASDPDQKTFYNEVPIQISGELVSQLSDDPLNPAVSPARQSLIDADIRSRIQQEAARLATDEEVVRTQIEAALERENIHRERALADEGEASSAVLLGDLEEVRQRVDRFKEKKELVEADGVREAGEAVVACYNAHPKTPLDCWLEVGAFRSAVAQVERKYVDSLR